MSMAVQTEPAVSEQSVAPRPWWQHPVTVAAVLTVLCLPLGDVVPVPHAESWRTGLSLVHVLGIPAGPGFVFTYGPLGFLAYPNLVWMPGALLGVAYIAGVAFALYALLYRALLTWLPAIAAILVTAAFAVTAAHVGAVSEFATAAFVLWGLTLVRPTLVRTQLATWVPVVFGTAAALQLLVKFGTGGAVLVVGIVVAATRTPRLRNVLLLVGSSAASVLLLWLIVEQHLGNLPTWLHESLAVAGGYSSAMAVLGGGRKWLLLMLVVAAFVAGLVVAVREQHARAAPFVILAALAAVYFVKEGFTRLDPDHAEIAYLGVGILVAVLPWPRRWMPVALAGIAVALFAVFAAQGLGSTVSQVRSALTHTTDGLRSAAQVGRGTVQPSYRDDRLARARASIRSFYGIPDDVVQSLRGARVSADPTEIEAVWAYGLRWHPVPVFQNYSAYTPYLDDQNANALTSGDGPNAVLHHKGPVPYHLGRVPAWDSPAYAVALTCNYEVAAGSPHWEALTRASDACGDPEPISTTVLHEGQRVDVPAPRAKSDLVIATFDYPGSLVDRLASSVLKPVRVPIVFANGFPNAFVAGTASQTHLLRVPRTIEGRRAPNGGLDIRTLSFPNSHGDVKVRFFEVPTR